MTAGRGIIHSEMPQQQDGLMWGFQLWVNLPAAEKMTAPRYQDIPPEDVPEVVLESGIKIRVLVGESHGVRGAVQGIATDPLYLDVQVPARLSCSLPVQCGHTAFCYVFDGAGAFVDDHARRTVCLDGKVLQRGDEFGDPGAVVLRHGDADESRVRGRCRSRASCASRTSGSARSFRHWLAS